MRYKVFLIPADCQIVSIFPSSHQPLKKTRGVLIIRGMTIGKKK